MRFILLVLVGGVILSTGMSFSQAPEGVKVKSASVADNSLAKVALEKALASETLFPDEMLGDTVTCGPTLWAALKGSAGETLLRSKIVTEFLSIPEPVQTVGRGLVSEEQRRAFWKLLRAKYPALRSATVRKASADEIRYFWATIPFDIEEPLFAVEAGPQAFIANLKIKNGKPKLFWIDLVGDLHSLDNRDMTPDEVKEFVALAEMGVPDSMYPAGRAYLLGKGVPVDLEKGRMWLDRAAGAGSIEAEMLLGSAYLGGTILPKDPRLASKYLLQVAQQQHVVGNLRSVQALAQYWLALMYEKGRGLEKSHEKAVHYLDMAASNGNSSAQFDLASLYSDGTGGITMDKSRACELFEKAADQGNVKAMHNTGYCYQTGIGNRKDAGLAIKYYTRAAELGETRAQVNLGILYGQLGQAENSYFWLRVAQTHDDTQGKSLLDSVKAHLTHQEIEVVEKKVLTWVNSHKTSQY